MTSITNLNYPTTHHKINKVTLNIAKYRCLGITVIGQTTQTGQSVGIYCGGIIKNSAAYEFIELIEAGDRIVEIDGEDIRHLDNDQAVQFLQIKVNLCLSGMEGNSGLIELGLLKFNQDHHQLTSETEYTTTIDIESSELTEIERENSQAHHNENTNNSTYDQISTNNWIKQQQYHTHSLQRIRKPELHDSGSDMISSTTISGTSPNSVTFNDNLTTVCGVDNQGYPITSIEQEFKNNLILEKMERESYHNSISNLTITTSMRTIIKLINNEKSGLKIKDRNWLRVVVPKAFLGADLVDWLHFNVEGLEDRRDAKKYAATLFQGQLIKATIQARRDRFSEKSYYCF